MASYWIVYKTNKYEDPKIIGTYSDRTNAIKQILIIQKKINKQCYEDDPHNWDNEWVDVKKSIKKELIKFNKWDCVSGDGTYHIDVKNID